MTAAMSKDGAQVLQGLQKVDLDVQDLKGRVNRLEGRMERLEARMDRLETTNGRILEQVTRIVKVLTEPAAPKGPEGLSAYLDKIERRITALKR
jgi:chromosome segregation ATPase